MSRQLNRDECDLVLQGAVVLACGGGGPLHFSRLILDDLFEDDYACIEPPQSVGNDEWMTMIALVGTPSKVQNERRVSHTRRPARKISPWGSPKSSPRVSPRNSPRTSPDRLRRTSPLSRSQDDLLNGSESGSPKPSFYEIVKHVMRVKFLCNGFPDVNLGGADDENLGRTPNNAARNTLLYLQQQCNLRSRDPLNYPRFASFNQFSYILTGELGAVNMATALYLSAINGVSIVDCDGAGRSVPLVNQITYADKFSVSPTAIMSPHAGPDFQSIPSTLLDFPCGAEKMVEEVAAALISDENGPFSPYIGYGTYVITGEQMGDVPVFGSYSVALEIGQALNTFQGEERAQQISDILTAHGRPNKIAFHGHITEKVLQSSNVKDTGHLTVTDINDVTSKLKMWYKNEVILAGKPREKPLFMAPDSICILPAVDEPLDISMIPDPRTADNPLEVYVIVVQADEKIKTDKVIKSFESIYRMFREHDSAHVYTSQYEPWLLADDTTNTNDHHENDDVINSAVIGTTCDVTGVSDSFSKNCRIMLDSSLQKSGMIITVQAATPFPNEKQAFFT
ncbi:uncharacterized protein LOC141911785 [Tubulanus polymorphus]|uniref:uncharacterized protein LOC141911785 n=1 Tax=Tubulanus polymorphus TaxID=672921 RepID=UPI003DA3C71A